MSMRLSASSPQADSLFQHLLKSQTHTKTDLVRKFNLSKQALNDLLGMLAPRFRILGLKLVGINPATKINKNKSFDVSESQINFDGTNSELICDPLEGEKIFVTRWYDFTSFKRKKVSITLKQKKNELTDSNQQKSESTITTKSLEKNKRLSRVILDDSSDINEVPDTPIISQSILKMYEETKFTLPREYFIVFTIIFLESGQIANDKLMSFLSNIRVTELFFDPFFDEADWTINENKEDVLFHIRKENDKKREQIFTDVLINKMKREGYLKLVKDDDNQLQVTFDWRFFAEMPNFNPTVAIESFCNLV
ncbi:hypothetical protein M153_7440003654 [Pseudoloma neurophilia]|uniref:Uncharacterized protein n=1 Tax=Pseudoloma neurophilia TaxID=146866 RepID=A0A0R0LW38_9MICR|nr:hypothetical protein M153_7440003654 [Pseudoloma neurophilia]